MSDVFDPEAGQPLPVTAENSVDVAVQVAEAMKQLGHMEIAADVEDRIRIGERKYGKRLQSFNGRDAMKDTYDEVLDALNYAKQVQIEGLDDGELFDRIAAVTISVKAKQK